jgi:hypothetical protein
MRSQGLVLPLAKVPGEAETSVLPMSALRGGLNGWTQHFILGGKDGVDSYETGALPGF